MSLQSQNGRGNLRPNSEKEEFMVMVWKPHFYSSTESSDWLVDEIYRKLIQVLFTEAFLGMYKPSHWEICGLNKF